MDLTAFAQFALSGVSAGCIYALVAVGFVLCSNVSRVVNFAQGEYVMIGGLVAASVASFGVSLPINLAAVALSGLFLGFAQERLTVAPIRHLPSFIPITVTLGVAVILRGLALLVWGKDPLSMSGFSGDGTFKIWGAFLPFQTLWIWALTATALVGLFFLLNWTELGRAIRACSSNPVAARLMGVRVERMSLAVFGMAGATGTLAGAVIAPIALANWSAGLDFGLKGFVAAIIGRFTSPTMAIVGGLGLGITEALAAGYISSGLKDAIAYGVLLLYLVVVGGALAGIRRPLSSAGQHE